ncbi:hypothetical protein ACM66B_004470 [Microbotryomycetes sp. NB124-2]
MLLAGGKTIAAGPVLITAVELEDDGGGYNYYTEEEAEEYYDEPEQAQSESPPAAARVPDQVFFDDQALSNCWLAAMYDYKLANPQLFTQVPSERARQFQHASAPLWYGPLPESEQTEARAGSGDEGLVQQFATAEHMVNVEPVQQQQQSTKRKRNKKKRQRQNGDAEDMLSWKRSRIELESPPLFSPKSPPSARQWLSEEQENDQSQVVEDSGQVSDPELPDESLVEEDNDARSPPALVDAEAKQAHPSEQVRRTFMFPDPPDVADLDERDVPDLDTADEQELLNAALWAWFTAGYNTALYNLARQRP